VVVAVVVAAEDEPEHQEGDIAELGIERIETQTSIAHFPPGYGKLLPNISEVLNIRRGRRW